MKVIFNNEQTMWAGKGDDAGTFKVG